MDKSFYAGHRQRMRDAYLSTGLSGCADHQILEYILLYGIAQKDVKPIAKALIAQFGSLENVLKADIEDLKKVSGIGESCAILINLFYTVNLAVNERKNNGVQKLSSRRASLAFADNALRAQKQEVLLLITLTGEMEIIHTHTVSAGIASRTEADMQAIISVVCRDRPSAVIIAHNHPQNTAAPSAADIDFTVSLRSMLHLIGVKILDHIIIGNGQPYSMSADALYQNFFL